MRAAVALFPGSNCEHDVVEALQALGVDAEIVFHRETDLADFDGVILPGGFAHGDALRAGAIARFSPIMGEVERMAGEGLPVVGICNGFQILTEAGLLPGAFIANRELSFICRFVDVEVTDCDTVLTAAAVPGRRLRIPLNSYEGNWVDPSRRGRIVVRYLDDPNGSQHGAAAVANPEGNVVGIMPHPERGYRSELGSSDGLVLLEGLARSLERAAGRRRVHA